MVKVSPPSCFGSTKHMTWIDDPSEEVANVEEEFQKICSDPSSPISVSGIAIWSLVAFSLLQLKVKLSKSSRKIRDLTNQSAEHFFKDKSCEKHLKERWTDRTSAFFLSASLAEDSTACRTIGEWLSLNRKVVNSYRRDAVSSMPIVYAIADLYRAKRFGKTSVEKKLDVKAAKSVRLLFEATCCVVYSENAEKASELFGESLELHAKSTQISSQKQPLFPADLLAVHHSLVWNALLMNSIELESPPKELLPYLVTRKSLGLKK